MSEMVDVDEMVTAKAEPSRTALRAQAMEAIGDHLKVHGSKNWKALRPIYAQVPDRTWWNWVASAKKARGALSQFAAAHDAAATPLTVDAFCDSNEKTEFVDQHIRCLNFRGMMAKQMRDIDLLQSCAMTEDGKIKNFAIFTKALALRERAVTSFANSVIPLTESLLREDFENCILDVVGAIDRDVAVKIVQRLANAGGGTMQSTV